jgi:hypothetical protein
MTIISEYFSSKVSKKDYGGDEILLINKYLCAPIIAECYY